MKKCPYCKEEIQEEAIKCKHCQSKLSESTNIKNKEYDINWRYVGYISLVIIAMMLAAAFWYVAIPLLILVYIYKKEAVNNYVKSKFKTLREGYKKFKQSDEFKWWRYGGYLFLMFLAVLFWYVSIPAVIIWYIWSESELKEDKKWKMTGMVVLSVGIISGYLYYTDYKNRTPSFVSLKPDNEFVTTSKTASITGQVDPKNSKVFINGDVVNVKDGNFSKKVRLTNKTNRFEVKLKANDKAKNKVLNLDRKLSINVTNPKDRNFNKKKPILIKGQVAPTHATLQINDKNIKTNTSTGSFSFETNLTEPKNTFELVANLSNMTTTKKVTLTRELTQAEKNNKQIKKLRKELESINDLDVDKNIDNKEGITIALGSLYGVAESIKDLIQESRQYENKQVKNLADRLESRYKYVQARELSQLRKRYGEVLGDALWEADTDVRVYGNGNKMIELVNTIFASNSNIKEIHTQLRETLLLLRFDRAIYKWTDSSYAEYTYFDIKDAPGDREIMTIEEVKN